LMFSRARRRLTLQYVALFAVVLVVFSAIFYIALAAALQPLFDLAPEITSDQAASSAYDMTLERVALALVVANVVVLAVAGVSAWVLAGRTLEPIADAHDRQRRFVGDASHEIRNPLAVIRATAESALSGPSDPAALRHALEVVVEAQERLTRMANDLLVLARAEGAPSERADLEVDLSVAVAEVIEADTLARDSAPPRITVSLSPGLLARGDPDEVARVVANLVDNAVRYGGPQAHIRVSTLSAGSDAIVEVADDGPGIAAADLARVTEPFYRVDSDASAPEGTGLGLAIASSLAHRNGGRLTLASEPGRGTTARLSLSRFM
jgi:signal transduction histidine kinase